MMVMVVKKIIDANWAPSSTVAPPPAPFSSLQSDTFCPIINYQDNCEDIHYFYEYGDNIGFGVELK